MSSKLTDGDIAEYLAEFAYDPLGFVKFAFDWGHGDLKAFDGPDIWQTEVLNRIGSDAAKGEDALKMAVSSGHGIGKGACTAWVILWAMSTRPHLSGVVTANTARQLETKTWRELAVWHKRLLHKHWFEWTATKFVHRLNRDTWFVAAIPWSETNTEAFAGLHAKHVLVIFDEASAIPDQIWDVCEGAMTTPGAVWCAFGNPTRNSGRFKDCFGAFKHRWVTWKVDSRHAMMTNTRQINQWIDDFGEDSDFVRVRVKGDFPKTSSSQLIDRLEAEAAGLRELPVQMGYGVPEPLIIGVDVARFGGDATVIAFRRGLDARSMPMIRLEKEDTMQVAARVSEIIHAFNPNRVNVDGGGVGGGVIDRLRQLGHTPSEVNFGSRAQALHRYANKRAEMWDRMRGWLKSGCVSNHKGLVDELCAPDYFYDQSDRLLLESKDDMKRRGQASPDAADALALTFAQSDHKPGLVQTSPRSLEDTHEAERYDTLLFDMKYDPFKN